MSTATRLFRVQLCAQLPGDHVFFIPELNNPPIRNASHDEASGSAPVRWENGLPYDQDR